MFKLSLHVITINEFIINFHEKKIGSISITFTYSPIISQQFGV